mmetsp:Transcript_17328/g.35744  ORF Transcript_17328/g.35744 Transcript_17328/m.35744 type:complete len:84 (-) Transcript_17328:615-866(-)
MWKQICQSKQKTEKISEYGSTSFTPSHVCAFTSMLSTFYACDHHSLFLDRGQNCINVTIVPDLGIVVFKNSFRSFEDESSSLP